MTELLLPLRDLLEFNLACYVEECAKSKPKARTLNDLERVLKSTFMATWHYQCSVASASTTPYLAAILNDMLERQENSEFAIARFFLSHRFPTTKSV